MATGNPGFGGGLRWAFQADALKYGAAVTVSTDTGHVGAPSNISFAINNPDGILDWSYRSLHESTVLAKQLAKVFYGRDVQHSYYTACSNGGRQGLVGLFSYKISEFFHGSRYPRSCFRSPGSYMPAPEIAPRLPGSL